MAAYLAGTVVVLAVAADFVVAVANGDVPQWWLAKLVGAIAVGALQRIAAGHLSPRDDTATPTLPTAPTSTGSA